MRIAQVAPLIESVPPKHYGGTERIVSYLAEELVRAGHEVTLFGSGDSVTAARLIAPTRRSLRKDERCKDPMAREVILIDHVVRNPSWWGRPLTTRVMHFWLTLTTIVALFLTLPLVETELFQVILALWLAIGLTLAALFIIGTKGSSIIPKD